MTANTPNPEKARLKAEAKFAVTRQGDEGDEQVRRGAEAAHRAVLEKIMELRALRLAKAGHQSPDDAASPSRSPFNPETNNRRARKGSPSP